MREPIEFKRDSLTIRGFVFGKEDKRKPAVILSHAFMANQEMCFKYAELLETMGYVCFTYDFCGGGIICSSDGRTEDMSVLTEKKDLEAVYNSVKSFSYVDEDYITLLGCSQGGLVTMMVCKEYSHEIHKMITLYPALCIPDDARNGKMLTFHFDPNNIPDIIGTIPMKLGKVYATSVLNMNVYDEIGGFDKPVLYLHGLKDEIVDIEYPRKAHTLYPNCTYREIMKGRHGFRGKADQDACEFISWFMKDLYD